MIRWPRILGAVLEAATKAATVHVTIVVMSGVISIRATAITNSVAVIQVVPAVATKAVILHVLLLPARQGRRKPVKCVYHALRANIRIRQTPLFALNVWQASTGTLRVPQQSQRVKIAE